MSGKNGAVRTCEEVAEIMTSRGYPMGACAVWLHEQSALKKLRARLTEYAPDACRSLLKPDTKQEAQPCV